MYRPKSSTRMPSSTPAICPLLAPIHSARQRHCRRHGPRALRHADDVGDVIADHAVSTGQDRSEDQNSHGLPEGDLLEAEHGRHRVIPDPAEYEDEDDEGNHNDGY